MVSVGVGVTLIVICAVSLHPDPFVPTTVYVMVVAGLAFTDAPVVALNPAAGLHEYVAAPDALIVTEVPEQILFEGAGINVTVGEGLMDIVTLSILVQPFAFVPVTVYVVATVGFAFTDAPVVALSPVAGLQV
jgi:hypothetical protein